MFYSITCPYCRFLIQPLEACVVCTHCRRVQHKACWEANSRCASEGCTGEPEDWHPDGGQSSTAVPTLAISSAGHTWLPTSAVQRASAPANSRRHVAHWPVSMALTALIVWALYQCVMLIHESGGLKSGAGHDLRVISGRVAVLRRPEPSAPALAELPPRTEVQVLSVTKDYVRVQTSSGQVGYVPRNRLDLPPPPSKKPK